MGPRGRKGWGSEGNLEKVRARRMGPRRWEAQNFAHDSPRAQTRTFKGRPSKTTPKFHEKTPRERERAKMGAGEGKKKERNFVRSSGRAVPRKGGPARARSAGGRSAQPKHTHTDVFFFVPSSVFHFVPMSFLLSRITLCENQ